jgi:hypothetical protein
MQRPGMARRHAGRDVLFRSPLSTSRGCIYSEGMRLLASWVLASVASAVLSPLARAEVIRDLLDEKSRDFVKAAAVRALERTRRSLTLGPMIGAAPGVSLAEENVGLQLGLGLVLMRYKVPILLSEERLREIMVGRAQVLVAERARAAAASGLAPTEEQMKAWALETWEQLKAEMLRELRPRMFEKPSFRLAFELDYFTGGGAWDARASTGFGLGPVYLNLGTGVRIEDGAAGLLSAALSVPMLLSGGLNSPVVHWFLRYDLPYTGRSEHSDRIFLGAQLALDVL